MSARPVIVVIHKFGLGGLTQAVLDQARMFSDLGHPTIIASLDSGREQSSRVFDLRRTGRLASAVQVRNVHDDHRRAWQVRRPDYQRGADPVRGLLQEPVTREPRRDHWYDANGTWLRSSEQDREGRLVRIDYLSDRTLDRREHLDKIGRVFLVEEFVDGKLQIQRFVASTGDAYLTRIVDFATGRGLGVVKSLPGPADIPVEVKLTGIPQWHERWLQSLVAEQAEAPFVIAESPSAIPRVAKLDASTATRFGMLHNNHYDAPFKSGSPIRRDHLKVFRAIESLDGIVVLSAAQRDDIVAQFGNTKKTYVVPNSTRLPNLSDVERDSRLVTIVTRLDPLKCLDEAIRIFQLVVARVPDARMAIFGGGPDEERLRLLVVQLELEDSVKFMGRTSEPHRELERSALTMLTSSREAMPLAVLEANACATPVICYDFQYGPETLIQEGDTGFVVPWGDQATAAKRVEELLIDKSRARVMGDSSRLWVEKHHAAEVVSDVWESILEASSDHK